MNATFLGKLPVTTPGTPQRITTDTTIKAAMIMFATPKGVTGEVAVGGSGLNRATGAKVMWETPAGIRDREVIVSPDGSNNLVLADYFYDASVAGEGPVVTYWQR